MLTNITFLTLTDQDNLGLEAADIIGQEYIKYCKGKIKFKSTAAEVLEPDQKLALLISHAEEFN